MVSLEVVADDVETPDELTIAWTQVDEVDGFGPQVTINDADKSAAWFTAPDVDVETPMGFVVYVTDGGGLRHRLGRTRRAGGVIGRMGRPGMSGASQDG